MKISELLRNLANEMDGILPDLVISQVANNIDNNELDPEDTNDSIMVPPLQAKLELSRKSEGMPNVYDKDTDEINYLKKNAGMRTRHNNRHDDDDGPFEG